MRRPCLERGCGQYAQKGESRCTEHHQAWLEGQRLRKGWAKARAEAIRKAGGRCTRCGSKRGLEVHHSARDPHVHTRLKVLCDVCHRAEHRLLAQKHAGQ